MPRKRTTILLMWGSVLVLSALACSTFSGGGGGGDEDTESIPTPAERGTATPNLTLTTLFSDLGTRVIGTDTPEGGQEDSGSEKGSGGDSQQDTNQTPAFLQGITGTPEEGSDLQFDLQTTLIPVETVTPEVLTYDPEATGVSNALEQRAYRPSRQQARGKTAH